MKNDFPNFLADAVVRMKPSATLQVAQLARDLKAQGRDIISLSTGEPDFRTPAHIIEAAHRAALEGKTTYPPVHGVTELRQAIADKLHRENGISIATQDVIVTSGAKQAISNAFIATINPGDEVIIPAPYWVSYPELVSMLGGRPVSAQTQAPRFTLTPEQLERAITPRTKWLLLNSPCNPSGTTYRADELQALGAVLERHPHVHVMTDDIYEYLVYGGTRFTTFSQAVPALAERTLVINGVSKAFAMTGWRIGYAAGPGILIKAMSKVQGQLSSGANMVAQWAAVAALNGSRGDVEAFVRTYDERRRLAAGILDATSGLSCPLPDGAFYLFPDCSGLLGRRTAGGVQIDGDATFARELLAAEGVAVVPGSAFGTPGHFRITFAIATDALAEACRRIKRFCDSLESR
jgi:aspartate aminotransferase